MSIKTSSEVMRGHRYSVAIIALLLLIPVFHVLRASADVVTEDQIERRVLQQINKVRLVDVHHGSCVYHAAENWNDHLIAEGTFVHQSMTRLLYRCNARHVGEIMAIGYRPMSSIVYAWWKSPAHRAVMLNPDFHWAGVGAWKLRDGRWLIVVDFRD